MDVARFELAASSLRTKRSSRLIYTPSARSAGLLVLAFTKPKPFIHSPTRPPVALDRFGLLVRCNPTMWDWEEGIPADGSEVELYWLCNLKRGSVPLHTPCYVLGTHGWGILADGYTSSGIEEMPGDPSTWKDGHRDKAASAPRIHMRLRRNRVLLADLEDRGLDYLIGRQSIFSWLTEQETFALEAICD